MGAARLVRARATDGCLLYIVPAVVGIHHQTHHLGVCFCEGQAAQSPGARQIKQARRPLSQSSSSEEDAQAALHRAERRLETWNDEDDNTGASFSQHCCRCSCLCLLASYPTPSFLLQASSNTASHTMSRRHRASAWPLRRQCARSWSSRQHRRRRMSRGWFLSIAILVTQKGMNCILDY